MNFIGQFAVADDPAVGTTTSQADNEYRLTDDPSFSAGPKSRPSAIAMSQLRQERATYRYNQRVARIEANAWIGYEPLRPGWSSLPMMSSRYPARRTVVVPVFVD